MNLIPSPRQQLIARMQAYAFEHILLGDIAAATTLADDALRGFDSMTENYPYEGKGYWAGFYFEQFANACRF